MPVNINKRNDVNSVNGQTGDVVLTANDINALPDTTNIPNKTSDLTNDSYFVSDENYVHTDNNYTTEEKNSVATIGDKVDKVEGKGLSTNDLTDDLKSDYDNAVLKIHEHSNKAILDNTTASYTTEEQSKLNGIEDGAEVNTVTGIKGDAETEYRTGNINITRENIGLEYVVNERQWSDNNHPTTVNGYGITDAATSEELQSETTRAITKENEIVKNLSSEISRATNAESEISTNLSSHINNISNPHNVTKNQIGLDNVENKSSDTIRSEITKDNVTAALGYTPYTPNEVDNMISSLETNIDWKESVATYDDIATTYPNPVDGWTVNVKDTDYTYRYNGTSWIAISANAIPKATNSVDGLLSKEDHTNYDDANSKKHTHENKPVLDGITDTLVSNWNSAKIHADSTHARTDATKVEKSTTNGNILINGTETNVYTHPSGTNPHGTTKSDVGLSNVPNVATNDQTPSYTEATTLEKLSSGEKLSVAFGKISKAITDLISHISDSVKHITSTERTNWNSAKTHADSAHAPSNAQANVIETVKVNGTALTPSSKAVDISVPTNNNQLTNGAGYITSSGTAKTISDTLPISKGGTGKTTGVDAANVLINSLSIDIDTPTDADYYVAQYAGGGTTRTTFHRKPVSALWNYIKSKLATVATSGSYNDLSNKPTIPTVGNGTITIKQAGTAKGTFTTNQSGDTTIELTDNNTTYGVATSSALGLVKSGTDITVDSSGNVSVNDDSHNHVISNVDGLQSALDGKASNTTLTNQDLNTVTTPGFYNAGGSNSVTNKPSGVDAFGLEVIHNANGNYYTQIIYMNSQSTSYRRYCINGTWGSWTQDKLTDTNTTYSAGTGLSLSGTTFSNSGVRSISTGSTNGTVSVNTNGTSAEVAVKGLGSAAYTASSAYATASHTHNYAGSSSVGGAANSAIYANKIANRGNHTEVASGTTANSPTTGMLETSGLFLTQTYGDPNTPANYGNIINIAGSGTGQLLCEWVGANNTLGHLYYRSHRDTSSGGWSSWGKVAFVTDNVATATKATQDASGNTITSTYANSLSISDNSLSLKSKSGATLSTVTLPTSTHEVISSTEPTNQSTGDYWIKRIN